MFYKANRLAPVNRDAFLLSNECTTLSTLIELHAATSRQLVALSFQSLRFRDNTGDVSGLMLDKCKIINVRLNSK